MINLGISFLSSYQSFLFKRVNPDFIITLPEGDTIVIDCKVSLKNFESFANEKDPKLRDHHIKKHVTSVVETTVDSTTVVSTKRFG